MLSYKEMVFLFGKKFCKFWPDPSFVDVLINFLIPLTSLDDELLRCCLGDQCLSPVQG